MVTIFRAIVIFLVLFFIMKVLGKKQIQHLTTFDYIIGITIGSISADAIINVDYSLINGILALLVFGGIGYLFSYFSYKNHVTEEILDGEPIVLFYDNHFIKENLSRTKISVSKILEHCRLKGCFDLMTLECVLLEPSGDFSILLKNNYQLLTLENIKKDFLKKGNQQTLCTYLIMDGKIDFLELEKTNHDEVWLKEQLKKEKLALENVCLCYVDGYKKIHFFEK